MSIYQKLFEIQKKNILLSPDADNPFYKSKYVTIENIMTTLKPLLEEQGLLVYHSVESDKVVTVLLDTQDDPKSEDSYLISSFPINNQLDAQKIGAMVTYGKRYNLVALFALIEEDDDGNSLVKNAPPSFKDTPKVGEPTQWFNKPELEQLFKELHEGIITAGSSADLVKKARTRWKVSKAMEGEIATRYQKEFI